jgi:hypothetical protein
MAEPTTRILILVRGGVVQEVKGDGDTVDVRVIDIDNLGRDEDKWEDESKAQLAAFKAFNHVLY